MAIKNVLIVDTNDIFISKLNGFFWEAGIKNVLTASTINEALEIISRHTPDLVLIDFLNEDICSLDAVKIIAEMNKSIRIIITTDIYNQDYCNEAFDTGADAFIEKSNFAEDLNTIINAVPKSLEYLFEKFLLSKN
jgi:two-component system response regulator (stage 0 sporulation protein F)